MGVTIIVAVIVAALAVVITLLVSNQIHEKQGRNKVNSAEAKAREIIDEAVKNAEAKKREAMLEAKEDAMKQKNDLDKESVSAEQKFREASTDYLRRKIILIRSSMQWRREKLNLLVRNNSLTSSEKKFQSLISSVCRN